MKKVLTSLFFLLIASICFSLPNIKLYNEGEFVCQIDNDNVYDEDNKLTGNIRDGKIYDAEKNEYVGTISEQGERLIWKDNEIKLTCEYNKETGYLLLKKFYLSENYNTETEYDEKSGLKSKYSSYNNGLLKSYTLYEYENGKLSKSLYYDGNGLSKGYTQYSYDKKTEILIREEDYDGSNHLEALAEYDKKTGRKTRHSYYDNGKCVSTITYEYDSKTGKKTKEKEYGENNILRTQTLYDKNTGDATEKIVYSSDETESEKYTFLKFDENGKYYLSDGFYLTTRMCWYSSLEDYAESSKKAPVDWSVGYSAIVSKYNFTEKDEEYKYIKKLKDDNYLSSQSFTLCNSNSNLYYCFTSNIENEIDVSSCYRIELIKKKIDYSAMNKSGKGKGPFGFDIGMTYEEVKLACDGREPEHISDDRYYVKPKKSHPRFEKYIVWISDVYGLYYIKAISGDIYSSDYGTELKMEFSNILSPLEKKYGRFEKTDTLKSDYYLKDEQYWTHALRDGARTYRAIWYVTNDNYYDYDGLFGIGLGTTATSTSKTQIWLEYDFQNRTAAEEALNDVL